MTTNKHTGPLADIKVLEFAGLGPAPFAGMLLADMGADVVRIDNARSPDYKPEDVESRGRQSIVLNLKDETEKAIAMELAEKADILIEGYRPGVMERLGLGPEPLLQANHALVYGRITGWGQDGPLASKAGHDINYLSITGALHAMGTREKPAIPLNLVADFGGGAMYLVTGVLAALHHARRTGQGQVVDAAMTEGVISQMNMIYGDFHAGTWLDERENNVIDGAAPFYHVYQCADDKWISLACIEAPFYSAFLETAPLDDDQASLMAGQWNRDSWPKQIALLESLFKTKTRDQWIAHFTDADVCIAPVLSLQEAPEFEHNRVRGSFQVLDGITQAGTVPKFSTTPASTPDSVQRKGRHREAILERWGIKPSE